MSRTKFTCQRAVCGAALFICLGSASAMAHGHSAASSTSPKNVAMSTEIGIDNAFRAALAAGNAGLAASYLSDDVIIYEEGDAEQSKAEYVGHHLPADIAFSQATHFVVLKHSEKILGDLAWTATQSRTTGTYHGRAINLSATETMVLRRVGGQWRIIHIHWSSKPASAAANP